MEFLNENGGAILAMAIMMISMIGGGGIAYWFKDEIKRHADSKHSITKRSH